LVGSKSNFSIAIVIPYFGKWPEWIELYFETLKRNSTIDFFIYTDCDTSFVTSPSNIHFRHISFHDYVRQVNKKLNIEFKPLNAYKLCDLRPLLGLIHEEDFKDYDFYGWCDVDLLFGDIRNFYTDKVLKNYDVISTHANRISGHLALFRNTNKNRSIYKKIYNWETALKEPQFVGIDEHGITNAYSMTVFDKFNEKFKTNLNNIITRFFKKLKIRKLYLIEQYTTPFLPIPWIDGSLNSKQPDTWFYKDGVITNDRDKRSFIYIHFMNFKNSQWRHDGTKAPWENISTICKAKTQDINTGIIICKEGILPIENMHDGRK
jgi:hypothetical protein